MSHPVPGHDYGEPARHSPHGDAPVKEKKQKIAKKMRPIGEDMYRTFKKFGKAVGKLKHHQKESKELAF